MESIGFRSTRIRTWPDSLVTIPNSSIAGSQIENSPKRKVSFTLVIDDEADIALVEQLVQGIREILRRHPGVLPKPALVNFSEFASDGLGVFIYYFTKSPAWDEHLQVRQDVNVAIINLLNELGVGLALPGSRIYLAPEGNEVRISGLG